MLRSMLLAALLMPVMAAPQPEPLHLVNPGKPVQRALEGGKPDVVFLPLIAGHYARVEVLQTGNDVVVNLFDPDGGKLANIDSPNGNLGPEPVSLVAAKSGNYRIEVTLDDAKQGRGAYQVTLLEERAALPADLELVAAEREFFEARGLQNQSSADSRKAAETKYIHASGVFQRAGRTYQQGLIANAMGLLSARGGDLAQALELFQQAARLFEQAPDAHMQLAALIGIGGMQDLLGQPQTAFATYEQALLIARRQNDPVRLGNLLNNIGKLQYDTGEWQQAVDHYREALEIHRGIGDTRQQGYALHNMATAYRALGQPEQALELYQQALPLLRGITGEPRGEAETLLGMANTYRDLKQPGRSVENYELSLVVRRAIGDRRGEADTLASLGMTQSRLSQVDAASATLAKSLELAKATGGRRIEALAMNSLAENSLRAAKAPEAADWASRSLAVYREIESRTGTQMALEQLARAESEQGKLDAARRHMEEALSLTELTRTRTDSEQLRTSFFADRQDAYGFYIGLLMRAHAAGGDPALLATAFETSERTRARGLIEMLSESGADPRRDADPALVRRQHEITQLLNIKGSRLFAMANAGSPAALALKREIRALELESGEVEAAIRKSSPRYAALTQPTALSLEQSRSLLDADTVLLEFTLAEPHSYLWIADRDHLTFRELPSRAAVETAARQTMQFVTARQDASGMDAARRLSEMLFGTSLPAAAGKRLAIVPDGALQTVPMAMLPIPGSSEPILTQHEVVTLPSLSALGALRQEAAGRTPAPKTVAVFADPLFESGPSAQNGDSRILEHLADTSADGSAATRPRIPRLPYTLREADEILRAAGPAASSLRAVGGKANRDAALNGQLSQYRFVHFATHGYLDTERPSLSALVLSQVDEKNRPTDGFLRVNDIYNIRLNADLVVLSACQTGLGKEVRGEGIMGLTRAFMYAGAPRVIVSLWNVNDRATATLMGSLYRKMLLQGMRPAEALRMAQLELRKNKQWASPYYWAAFQLQGDWK